jgi:hypothetical protein
VRESVGCLLIVVVSEAVDDDDDDKKKLNLGPLGLLYTYRALIQRGIEERLCTIHTAKGCWMKAALQEGIRDVLERKASMAAQSLDGTALCFRLMAAAAAAAAAACFCCCCRRIAPGWSWWWHAALISSRRKEPSSSPSAPRQPQPDALGSSIGAATATPIRSTTNREELRLFHQDLGK